MSEPTVEVEPRRSGKSGRGRSRGGSRVRRWLRRAVLALVLIAALPFLLTLLYLVPGTRPVSTLMAGDLATLRFYDRRWVPIGEISPNLVNSVLMSEDGQFCAHRGIDWGELNAVIEQFRAGEATRGASTIPMQTAKNLYLWPGRSYLRKAAEFPLAIYLDAVMPKKRIMEIYLNIAEWGPGVYGAEAAAQTHFGRPASELTRRQAALLAVTLPNPAARDPARPGQGMNRLAARVERLAGQAGGYNGCVR